MDLACSDGRHTLRLSEKVGEVIALDLSSNNLDMARRKCSGSRNICFVKASMFELPFPENTFNGIWFPKRSNTFRQIEEADFYCLLEKILRPSGILYMSAKTWIYQDLLTSLGELLSNFVLYCYWKVIRRKPPLTGEYLYYVDLGENKGVWYYHVHIDERTLIELLTKHGLKILKMDVYDGYIYTLLKRECS